MLREIEQRPRADDRIEPVLIAADLSKALEIEIQIEIGVAASGRAIETDRGATFNRPVGKRPGAEAVEPAQRHHEQIDGGFDLDPVGGGVLAQVGIDDVRHNPPLAVPAIPSTLTVAAESAPRSQVPKR